MVQWRHLKDSGNNHMHNHNERKDEDHTSELAGAAAAVTILAASQYDVEGNTVNRTLELGPVKNNSSIGIEGNKLVQYEERGFNIPDVIVSNESHEKKSGLFSREEHHEQDFSLGGGIFQSGEESHIKDTSQHDNESTARYLKVGGIFSSEETTYKKSGPGGTVQGREAETSCCGLTVSSSEESNCCTSESLCGYKCSTNFCGEDVSLNCNTVCCFRPISNRIGNIDCPSIPTCDLPNICSIGNCSDVDLSCIESSINNIDCQHVSSCLENARPVLEAVWSVVSIFIRRN